MVQRFRFPNTLVIMIGFILFASLLAYTIPQGEYTRETDSATGRTIVVPGSFHHVPVKSLSVFQIMLSVPEGIIGRADLIVLILLLGGCFYVIERTGALRQGIIYMTSRLRGREEVALLTLGLLFALGGVFEGLQEEIIPMTTVVLLFSRRLGYNPYVAVAISYGAAVIGGAFSPINPFGIVIAQKVAELPFLSGAGYRLIILLLAFALWMAMVIRYANSNKVSKERSTEDVVISMERKHVIILGLLLLAFAILVMGMLSFDWGFNEISAEFFVLGICAGLIGGLGINGTSEAYIEGFREMTFACVIIGLANSISVVLQKGIIIDSIIHGLFLPLAYLPVSAAAILMMLSQALLHLPIPSYSGQAIVTMPVLVPLSDLIGLSRQVTVLAYQYGAIVMDMLVPTNGALMAILVIAGIPFDQWLKFALKPTLIIMILSSIAITVAVFIGF